jgi:hypothetical protein
MFLLSFSLLISYWALRLTSDSVVLAVNALLLLVIFSGDGIHAISHYFSHAGALLDNRVFVPLVVMLGNEQNIHYVFNDLSFLYTGLILVPSVCLLILPEQSTTLDSVIIMLLVVLHALSTLQMSNGDMTRCAKYAVVLFAASMITMQLVIVLLAAFLHSSENVTEVLRQIAAAIILTQGQISFWRSAHKNTRLENAHAQDHTSTPVVDEGKPLLNSNELALDINSDDV